MLRLLVLLLLLLNGLYFAWSQGLLRELGWAPTEQSEPQRLRQQIHPQAIRIVGTEDARRLDLAAQAPTKTTECLQLTLFDESQARALQTSLEATFPMGSWEFSTTAAPARWIIYMGKYPSAEALAIKQKQLAGLKVPYEALSQPALEPGLSLGRFNSEAAAQAALTDLGQRGVRSAHVLLERAERQGSLFKFPAVDAELRSRLAGLKSSVAEAALQSCH